MIEAIGVHKVKHGNVMDGIDDLMLGEKAEVFYSDPPWGTGNIKYWQTQNIKMNKLPETQRRDVEVDSFLEQIFQIASKFSKGVIFIEYGIRWEQNVRDLGFKHGLTHNAVVVTKYGSGKTLYPLHLHIFSKGQKLVLTEDYLNSLKDTKGFPTVMAAVKPFVKEGGIVLDPCCGMGYSAQVAINYGMMFRGNELNRTRLDKTIARLRANKKRTS